MEDQPIGQLLRDLPAETARPGFTARVVARLDRSEEAERRPALRPRLAWTAALVTALAISAGLIGIRDRPAPATPADTAEARRILEELKAEHSRLEQDFQELREPSPVYYLGGNEEIDLVVDLSNVTEGPEGDVAVPAAYRPTETF